MKYVMRLRETNPLRVVVVVVSGGGEDTMVLMGKILTARDEASSVWQGPEEFRVPDTVDPPTMMLVRTDRFFFALTVLRMAVAEIITCPNTAGPPPAAAMLLRPRTRGTSSRTVATSRMELPFDAQRLRRHRITPTMRS
jgi:hypothetical protein